MFPDPIPPAAAQSAFDGFADSIAGEFESGPIG
jgi:hypothetical protein